MIDAAEMFFRLSSLELWLIVFAIVLGTTLLGVVAGRRLRSHAETSASRSGYSRRLFSASWS